MDTLGIDFSAEPAKTAFAVIRWSESSAAVEQLAVGIGNQALMPLIARADKVGIDCPLGWPLTFWSSSLGTTPGRWTHTLANVYRVATGLRSE